jgi:hypothetical protein
MGRHDLVARGWRAGTAAAWTAGPAHRISDAQSFPGHRLPVPCLEMLYRHPSVAERDGSQDKGARVGGDKFFSRTAFVRFRSAPLTCFCADRRSINSRFCDLHHSRDKVSALTYFYKRDSRDDHRHQLRRDQVTDLRMAVPVPDAAKVFARTPEGHNQSLVAVTRKRRRRPAGAGTPKAGRPLRTSGLIRDTYARDSQSGTWHTTCRVPAFFCKVPCPRSLSQSKTPKFGVMRAKKSHAAICRFNPMQALQFCHYADRGFAVAPRI